MRVNGTCFSFPNSCAWDCAPSTGVAVESVPMAVGVQRNDVRNWKPSFYANVLEDAVFRSLSKERGQQRFCSVQLSTTVFKLRAIRVFLFELVHRVHLPLYVAGHDGESVDRVFHHRSNHRSPWPTLHF